MMNPLAHYLFPTPKIKGTKSAPTLLLLLIYKESPHSVVHCINNTRILLRVQFLGFKFLYRVEHHTIIPYYK